MNKKGQTLGLVLISLIVFLIIGLMMTNFVMDEITEARTNMSCSDVDNISDATKLLCLGMDSTVFFWVFGVFGVIVGIIAGRMR